MRKLYCFIFLFIISFPIFSQSVAELTLINIETDQLINFYDSADKVLEQLGERVNSNPTGGNGTSWFENEGKNYILKSRKMPFMLNNQDSEYKIDIDLIVSFEVFSNYKTIRDIKIGSSKCEVIRAYPNFWDWPDNEIAVYWDYGDKKRTFELDIDIMYGFVFTFDENDKVKSIRMDYILTSI